MLRMTQLIAKTQEGWIVPIPHRRLTPNRYHQGFRRDYCLPIEFAVYHYTAGGFEGSISWLCSVQSSASAHFIVKKDGEIWQLAPLTDRTWHAGGPTSTWRSKPAVNNRSIGIEIENIGGPLSRMLDQTPLDNRQRPYKAELTVKMPDGNIWDLYPESQILSVIELTQRLKVEFPTLADGAADRLVGHQDVDPKRKRDPGPAFPWGRIRG